MVATRQVTVEEFEAMPNDGKRYELVEGELREMPPPGLEHGDIGSDINGHLWLHVRAGNLGRVYTEVGYRIFADRNTVYAPDVSFVRSDRVATIENYEKLGRMAPDLAVEIVSPSDTLRDVLDKVRNYLAAGVGLVWVVEPRRRLVTAQAPGRAAQVYGIGDILDGGDVLPDFRLPVAEIFA